MSRFIHTSPTKHQRRVLVKQAKQWLWWTFVGLLIYMPLHIFLTQSLSQVTGGLDIWKVAKDAVIIVAAAIAGILLWSSIIKGRSQKLRLLTSAVLVYGLIHLLFLSFVDLDPESSLLATIYNNRLSMLLIIGLFVGIQSRNLRRTEFIYKVVLGISGAVAAFAVAQYFLPTDFMENLGYSFERGARGFFGIDNKPDLPRVFSTIRDPNSLGAFLLVTMSLIASLYVQLRKSKRKLLRIVVVLAPIQVAAIWLTFSRSAWLGVIIALAFVAWHIPRLKQYLTKRNIMLATVFAVLVGIVMYPTVRDSYVAENVIFHSDETTTDLGSSQKHIQYIIDGAKDVAKRPAGYGPGTAGIVSIRNERGTVLTENYYVQIAYEVGILGLLVFVLINYLVYQLLRKSPANALKMALLASFWGLIATNMLLHTWSNEAVAVVWWMLAGYQIGLSKEFE